MRYVKPEIGTERAVKFFAMLPVTIGRETRWLERVKVKQRYQTMTSIEPVCGHPVPSDEWTNVEFLNK